MSTPKASDFLKVAAGKIGYREGQDANGNWNNLNMFGEWYGNNGVAWCAQFVSWCANEVGALDTLVPKYQSTFAGLTWFRARKLSGNWPPRPGDIFMESRYAPWAAGAWNDTTGDGWLTVHTGIVEKYLGDGKFQTIEGNTNTSGSAQGNGVYRLTREDTPNSSRYIFCRPQWAPEEVPPPKPKTLPGSVYTGPRYVDVSTIRPEKRNESSRRFNGLLWAWLCKNSPAYAEKNLSRWMKESSDLYGLEAQRATQEMYRIMSSRNPEKFSPVTLPTWPGWSGVRAVGGNPG